MSITSGVNAGSGASSQEQYIIFSIDDQSPLGVNQAINFLISEGIGYKPIIGAWQNQVEAGYIINYIDWHRVQRVLAKKQMAIVHLSAVDRWGYRDASEVYLEASGSKYGEYPKPLGKFMNVSPDTVKAYDGWTYDLESKQYYVALGA